VGGAGTGCGPVDRSAAAEALLTRSLTLVHRLPATLAALEAGALHPGHRWPMLEKVAPTGLVRPWTVGFAPGTDDVDSPVVARACPSAASSTTTGPPPY
jgi:hypothetical protein